MSDTSFTWFKDFMGVGYQFYHVHAKALLIFEKRKKLVHAWKNVIKWWPDDEIRMRFVERDDSYDFVLYGESRILLSKFIFLKGLKISDHYRRFKDDYTGAAYLGLAMYRPKDDSYELEIFNYSKRVTNLQFLKEDEVDKDSIVLRSVQILRGSESN